MHCDPSAKVSFVIYDGINEVQREGAKKSTKALSAILVTLVEFA